MKRLIQKGRVVDPTTGIDAILDILIDSGKIAEIKTRIETTPHKIIDATGLVVVPGLIDLHVHLREPGFEHKETIASGARAAAKGGFTTVCCMPNTHPVNDCRSVTEYILVEAGRNAPVHVLPIASITKGLEGEELTDMRELFSAGAIAFSDDGHPIMNSRIMRRALEIARSLDSLVIDHCEDAALSDGGLIHEGESSRRLGVRGIPAASEDIMVARDIILAEASEARIHIAHLSSRGAVQAVRLAKERKIPISAEATPHHLLLTESSLKTPNADFKMNPPLRSQEDREALVEALRSGGIDVIATDHAPHTSEEKGQEFGKAPFGVVGLDTAVSLILDRFVRKKIISLARFVELMSVNPARLLNLKNKGQIVEGKDADFTLLDLTKDFHVDRRDFESKGKNTPFDGWKLKGAVAMTIVSGKVVFPFDDDKVLFPERNLI